MRAITKDGYIDGVALFLEVTDTQLDRIKQSPDFFFDPVFLQQCYDARGDNAHMFHLYSTTSTHIILDKINTMLDYYKTVSWWDRTTQTFYIRKKGDHDGRVSLLS